MGRPDVCATARWADQYLRSFAGTIAGGTSEIQRNIIAERVLGLPRDECDREPGGGVRPPVGSTGRDPTGRAMPRTADDRREHGTTDPAGSRPRPRWPPATWPRPTASSTWPSTSGGRLQDYSINWITSLLTFIGEELGEEAVERALRKTGDEFVRPRRTSDPPWEDLPAAVRARVIARAMVANIGRVEVTEDDEKIVLAFRCGSGGRLIDEGRYEGDHAYLTLREPGPRTFIRDALPGLLRPLLGQQRDPARRVGRHPDQHRVPAREAR